MSESGNFESDTKGGEFSFVHIYLFTAPRITYFYFSFPLRSIRVLRELTFGIKKTIMNVCFFDSLKYFGTKNGKLIISIIQLATVLDTCGQHESENEDFMNL